MNVQSELENQGAKELSICNKLPRI